MLMNDKLYEKELNYRLSIVLAHTILEQGYLDQKEFKAVHKKLLKKYQPPLGELLEVFETSTKEPPLWNQKE